MVGWWGGVVVVVRYGDEVVDVNLLPCMTALKQITSGLHAVVKQRITWKKGQGQGQGQG